MIQNRFTKTRLHELADKYDVIDVFLCPNRAETFNFSLNSQLKDINLAKLTLQCLFFYSEQQALISEKTSLT